VLYPAAANSDVLPFPIELSVTANSAQMNSACLDQYKRGLAADLIAVSQLVNEMICNGSMCSYLTGAPGSGVVVNEEAIFKKYVFAAIDVSSLSDPVTFTVDSLVCRQLSLIIISHFN